MVICWELIICRSQPLSPRILLKLVMLLHRVPKYIANTPIWVYMSVFYAYITKFYLINTINESYR